MSRISEKKHDQKKSPKVKNVDLSVEIAKANSTAPQFAGADQLKKFTQLDDAGLRRLANSTNPATGKPWIPKPARGQYAVTPTILGALAWWHHQAARNVPDHPTYADMGEAETRGLIPREFQKYAKIRGVDFINLNRSIKIEPLRQLAAEILRKIFADKSQAMLESIEGAEYLNSDAELAKLRREQRLDMARKNAEADGVIHNKARIEELLWENGIAPLRAGLLSLRKTAFAQVDAELDKAEVAEPVRAVVKGILVGAIETLLSRIRQSFPKKDPTAKEKS